MPDTLPASATAHAMAVIGMRSHRYHYEPPAIPEGIFFKSEKLGTGDDAHFPPMQT